jgi:hypothetical protein
MEDVLVTPLIKMESPHGRMRGGAFFTCVVSLVKNGFILVKTMCFIGSIMPGTYIMV